MSVRTVVVAVGATLAAAKLLAALRRGAHARVAFLMEATELFLDVYEEACEQGIPVAFGDQLDKTIDDLSRHLDARSIRAVQRDLNYGLKLLGQLYPVPTA